MENQLPQLSDTKTYPKVSNPSKKYSQIFPGVAMAVALATVATVLGKLAPIVGAPVFAIVIGIVLSTLRKPKINAEAGLKFSAKTVLQASIVILGTGLSFTQVVTTGTSSMPVLIGTLLVALVGAWFFGRLLGITKDLRSLIGVGTAICGASAVAATDAVISASESDVSYAIATIFTFNVAAVLTFPSIGHALGMTSHAFGLWAGTAVNDVSSVVAAASIFSPAATSYAIIVKLTRTLMIIPITLALSFVRSNKSQDHEGSQIKLKHFHKVLPIFIAWFLLAVTLNTFKVIPAAWHSDLSYAAQFMITVALGAIGLSSRVDKIRSAGIKPLALGAILWILVASTSIVLQSITGTI